MKTKAGAEGTIPGRREHEWTIERAIQSYSTWWPVRLLPDEVSAIERLGRERNRLCIADGWHSKTTNLDPIWNISGVAGEYAAALILNAPWSWRSTRNIHELRAGDLPNGIEVKSRRERDPRRWDLAVNVDQIHDDRIYINMLTSWYPAWVVACGWAFGREIRERGETRVHSGNGHTIRILPLSALRPIVGLFDRLRG